MVFFFLSFIVLLYIFYVFLKTKHNVWTQKGVEGPKPSPIVGNFGKIIMLKQSVREMLKDAYEKYPNEKIVGLYQGLSPALLIRDPELITQILIKDFPVFQDRGRNTISGGGKLLTNLFMAKPETWKKLRQKLTPVFSSKKLKDMSPIIEQCINDYIKYVENFADDSINHEIKSLNSKCTLQVIGSCFFGVNLDTFKDEEDKFSTIAKRIFDQSTYCTMLRILDMVIPGIRKLDRTTDVQNFFLELVSKVIKQRENEPMKRKDFMDLMIELRKEGKIRQKNEHGVSEIEMDDAIITAQAFIFYAAGFETTSSAMSFMLHELALHQDVQNKVYEEICRVTEKHNGKINYDTIKEMTYLEMVLHETMRTHTVTNFLSRKSLENYILPEVNVTIPKGTLIYISQAGIHFDKKYYYNPRQFDPDHFTPENVAKRPHSTYLAFGDGPRNCIGKRFAMIVSMMAMAAFLRQFKVKPSPDTKAALDYTRTVLSLQSKNGIWLQLSKR